jgi:hypothetical protein
MSAMREGLPHPELDGLHAEAPFHIAKATFRPCNWPLRNLPGLPENGN